MQNPVEIAAAFDVKEHVNMIRHHTPGVEQISFAIEEPQSICDHVAVLLQDALAVARVEV